MVGVALWGTEDWEVGGALARNGVFSPGDAEEMGPLFVELASESDGDVLVVRDGAVPATLGGDAEPPGDATVPAVGETAGDGAGNVVPPVAPPAAGLFPAVVPPEAGLLPAVVPSESGLLPAEAPPKAGLLPAVVPSEAGLLPAVVPPEAGLLLAPPAVDDNHIQSCRLCRWM